MAETKTNGNGSAGNGMGNPWFQAQKTLLDETAANFRRLAAIPGFWQQAQRVKKGATPSEVVYENDRLRLLRYLGEGPIEHKTPLVLVFALVNRPYILDILPRKSVVSHFVKAGFDTYLIDWTPPTLADRYLDLNDYVCGYLRRVMKFLQERTDSPQINVLGYCMGGTMSAMFTALFPEYVKNLIMLAAGVDFSTREGLLNLWADAKNFDVDAFVDANGNCPAEHLQACFTLLKPIRNIVAKPIGIWERLDDKKHVEEFLTMETWLNDNVPVAGEVYRQFVKDLYQQNLLVQNKLKIGRRTVDLKQIICPVLNLLAEFDDLVPPSQSEPFCKLVGSTDCESITLPAGHIGLAMGSAAQRELWPHAAKWLAKRS
jgi:polyhydroxyalkanoate synthase subunit PhaC